MLSIRALGDASVLVDGREPDWHADSARTLLFYLLGHPGGQAHGVIVQALWNPRAGGASVACLRVAVCRLRAALGPGSVVTDRHRYRLARAVLEQADTHQFTSGLQAARREPGADGRRAALQRALSHYGGEYLPLEDREWAQPLRAHLSAEAARASLELSALLDGAGQPDAALAALSDALRRDPLLSERHHQALMLRLAQGDRCAATEHYRRYVRYLRAEVGDAPMRETAALARRIRDGRPLPGAPLTSPPGPA